MPRSDEVNLNPAARRWGRVVRMMLQGRRVLPATPVPRVPMPMVKPERRCQEVLSQSQRPGPIQGRSGSLAFQAGGLPYDSLPSPWAALVCNAISQAAFAELSYILYCTVLVQGRLCAAAALGACWLPTLRRHSELNMLF